MLAMPSRWRQVPHKWWTSLDETPQRPQDQTALLKTTGRHRRLRLSERDSNKTHTLPKHFHSKIELFDLIFALRIVILNFKKMCSKTSVSNGSMTEHECESSASQEVTRLIILVNIYWCVPFLLGTANTIRIILVLYVLCWNILLLPSPILFSN